MNDKPSALLRKYATRERGRVAALTVTFALSAALLVLAPQALSRFVDGVYDGAPWGGVIAAIAAYLALTLAQAGVNALLNVQVTSIGQRITDACRRDVLARYLALDAETLAGWTSGEAVTRIDEDAEGLFKYYYILLYKLTGSALLLVAILVTLALRSLWLCAALLVVSVTFVLVFKLIQDRGVAKYVRSSKATAAFNGSMKETLSNAAALRALGAEGYGESTLRSAMRRRFAESFPASLMYGRLWSAATLMECAVLTAGLAFAVSLWDAGAVSLGTAYMIYTYASMVCGPLQDFRNHMGAMQDAKAGILRTQALLAIPHASDGKYALPDAPLDVVIEGLSFGYAGGGDVLRDVSVTIPAGRSLGLTGETGCGKSTLVSCVAGMNRYARGSIRIGGYELRDISRDSLRERVACCAQSVRLLHATLRENIALYDESIPDADILRAIEQLGLTSWLSGFPRGLDTPLALGEYNLSMGEARLVALIRLALRRPRVVLLDEITAGLDERAERHVSMAARALCEGCTVIAVAHNARSLDWMDEVARMVDGELTFAHKEG